MSENLSSQICACIKIYVLHSRSLPLTTYDLLKSLRQRKMALKKQTVIHNAATTRSKAASTAGGTIPRLVDDRLHVTEDTGFSLPQEPVASIQPSHQREDQLLSDALRDERANERITVAI